MREVVIDTETTGLSYKSGDRIIEVGCVELINHVATNNSLQFYCKVDKEISESAQKITGITNRFLSDKKSFADHCDELLSFINNDPLIIHNADFDVGFLNNELLLIGKTALTNPIIDTVSLARSVLNTRVANLDYLCRRFDIDLSDRSFHGALLDSQLLASVYLELRGGKQFSMKLDPVFTIDTKSPTNNINEEKTKKIILSAEDISSHKEMLKKIKNPIWNKFNY